MSKPYHHGDLRRALTEAALELVDEGGPAALSLRAAAQRAGVSHAAPYRHFANQAELWAAVAEECFQGLLDSMQSAVRGAEDPLDHYLRLGQGYLEYGLAHPHHYRVIFGPVPSENCEAGKSCFQALVDGVVACQQAGLFRPGDPLALALGSWSLVHGLTSLFLDGLLENLPALGQDRSRLFRELALLQVHGMSKE